MAVYKGSRYVKTSLYRTQGKTLVFVIRKRPRFNPENFTYYTWVDGDNMSGVAYRQYSNAQLWWAIMDANPLYTFDTDILPGAIIAIPSYVEVVRLSG